MSFLLILSFSVLLGHSLVPHHHHAEVVMNPVDDHCPADQNDHQDAEKTPFHCHAFNEITFYQNSDLDIQKRVRVNISMELLYAELKGYPNTVGTCIAPQIIPIELSWYNGSFSTRGPPQSG